MTNVPRRAFPGLRIGPWTTTALALAAIILLAVSTHDRKIVLVVEGWRQEYDKDGDVYYRCASQICAVGSGVSFKGHHHQPALTLEDFEDDFLDLAEAQKGRGHFRDVRISEAKESTIEGVRVLQISREVDWDDGTKTFFIHARLVGPGKSSFLNSHSPEREWVGHNFDNFLGRLIDCWHSSRLDPRCN